MENGRVRNWQIQVLKTLDQYMATAGGVLILSKNPIAKETTLHEYAKVSQDQFEVTESALVKDILYSCHGIEGRFIKFDKYLDSFAVSPSKSLRGPSNSLAA